MQSTFDWDGSEQDDKPTASAQDRAGSGQTSETVLLTLDWDRIESKKKPSGFVLARSAEEYKTYKTVIDLLTAILQIHESNTDGIRLVIDPSHFRPRTKTSKSQPLTAGEIDFFFTALWKAGIVTDAWPSRYAGRYSKGHDGHGQAAMNMWRLVAAGAREPRPFKNHKRVRLDRGVWTTAVRTIRTDIERKMDEAYESAPHRMGEVYKREAFDNHPETQRLETALRSITGEGLPKALREPRWVGLFNATFFGCGDHYHGIKDHRRLGWRFVTKKLWGFHAEGYKNEARSILYHNKLQTKPPRFKDRLLSLQKAAELVAKRLCEYVNQRSETPLLSA